MLDNDSFRIQAHKLVDWMADFYQGIEKYPVRSQVNPGDVLGQLPKTAPQHGEKFAQVFNDFEKIILPGITHWQSPNFHAYFPGNSSYPSMLGEMLTATLAAQCMIWETSPAAAELEELVMHWLKEMMALPATWDGCIQDSASTATLCALICAREQATAWNINESGFANEKLRFYCSTETHSSIDKAVKILGAGKQNLIKIAVDDQQAMKLESLEMAILADIKMGFKPCAVIASIGTTGTLAVDPLRRIGEICVKYGIWLHVDAAYAGTAMILPEYRYMIDGLELADSYLFNPHKWMFTNFDCTAYFVKNKSVLTKTFEILPEYLKTNTRGKVNDYRDWGIPLGRRFRALKLWFVIRDYGIDGLQNRLREHIAYATWLSHQIISSEQFELIGSPQLNVLCFRWNPNGKTESQLNEANQMMLNTINEKGGAYMTHTKIGQKLVIRIVVGQTYIKLTHVEKLWRIINDHKPNLN